MPVADEIDVKALTRRWVHSHEEDTAEGQVFRPDDRPFPPSRGRRRLDLSGSGDVVETMSGPDDRQRDLGGNWRVEGNRLVLNVEGRSAEQLEVVSVEPDKLVVRPGN